MRTVVKGGSMKKAINFRCGRVLSMDLPKHLSDYCTRYGGLTVHGWPRFRIAWGANRCTWKTKKFHDRDDHGKVISSRWECRWVPKYPEYAENWIIEWWRAPETFGDPEVWFEHNTIKPDYEQPIRPMHPYPSRGEYEISDYFVASDGKSYALPSEGMIKLCIDQWRVVHEIVPGVPAYTADAFMRSFEEKEKGKEQKMTSDILAKIKDETLRSRLQPTVYLNK
jgi:hypothetical protein